MKILNKNLNSLYTPPNAVHGFVKGRNIKSNASVHLTKKYIYKVDIEKYFESIDSNKVIDALIKLGFTAEVSALIAKIVTHNNILVQGFHTSPTIANLVFTDLDEIFYKIKDNIEYTRYADDLYFSSNSEFDIHEIIAEKLLKYGFTLNEEKTELMKRGQNQYVTGLTVFDSKSPRIAKRIKRKLRQDIHYITKYGYKGHVMHKLRISKKDYKNDFKIRDTVDFEIQKIYKKINGWLLFINSIEPEFSKKQSSLLYDKNRSID